MAVPDGKVSGPAPVMAGARDIPDETSEYSRLAVLIDADNARPSVVGGLVIGFGERKTPQPFVAACDRFV